MIRITGGRDRSRLLLVPERARPSMDRVREAVFSSLGKSVDNASVLDLFAGSGAYGFEALSRGARRAVFVDADEGAIGALEKNREALRARGAIIVKGDWKDALRELTTEEEGFDVVFLDPPYAFKDYGALMEALFRGRLLRETARIVLEAHEELQIAAPAGWERKEKRYGFARIMIYKRNKA